VYGEVKGVPNVVPEGFEAVSAPRWEGRIAGQLLMFQRAEWTYCSPRYSDVVVLRWSPRSLTLLPALLRARMFGVATVLWGHGYSKSERSWWRATRNWFARQATALVFYEPRTRDAFVRDGNSPDNLFVALNSLDNQEIDQARQWWLDRPEELSRFRAEQGIDAGPMILFVSRLQPANRVDLLIEATAILVREIPTLKTVIIGNGAAEKAVLEKQAASLGITNAVMFQDGIYDERKLAPWFLSADVFCYPSNIGLSLLHALWYGLPVVTTDNLSVQNPEIVALENEVNGLTYEHENVSSLASQLRRILCDVKLRRSLSEAARRSVEGRFTIRNMVDGLESAIRYAYQNMQLNRRR
jgi:glycosyltransferase involved in cell wall biosynthesis